MHFFFQILFFLHNFSKIGKIEIKSESIDIFFPRSYFDDLDVFMLFWLLRTGQILFFFFALTQQLDALEKIGKKISMGKKMLNDCKIWKR